MSDNTQWWDAVLAEILNQPSITTSIRGILQNIRPVGIIENKVLLAVPNQFTMNFLADYINPLLLPAIKTVIQQDVTYDVFIDPSLELQTENSLKPKKIISAEPVKTSLPIIQKESEKINISTKEQTISINNNLNSQYTFDSFVIGPSNRFSHAAALAVAESPGIIYNPLFIYGSSGLGKTHLLHAIGNYVTSTKPEIKVLYVNSEEFTNEFINSISNNSSHFFHRHYRDIDVLIIDDIQFLNKKEGTLEAFFHTFNALHQDHKQIVITSDVQPKDLLGVHERMRSRFISGITTDVIPPDLETRIAILKKKASLEKINVPDDVLAYIASNITSNIRELEGALIRVTAFASLNHELVSIQIAETILKDLLSYGEEQEITPALIMGKIADYYDLTVDQICSGDRSQEVSHARQIAMYLCRELTSLSLSRIGQVFGSRDHTTVLYANKKISEKLAQNSTIFNQVQEITIRIKHNN